MVKNVIKRDGNKEPFDTTNIIKVIKKANSTTPKDTQTDDKTINKVLDSILNELPDTEDVDVEVIQDAVEKGLMQHNCFEQAKAFILKRDERAKERFKRLSIVKTVNEKLSAKNPKQQNANLDEHSFGGRKGEADSALLKQLALDYYISPKFAKNHINNRVYIHDLDAYVVGMHNCLSIPLDELLSKTVVTRQTKIRPAGSVNTALQLAAVYIQLQSLQQFGGVAYTHFDWSMVPYVRKSFMKHYIIAYLKETDDFYTLNLPDLMFSDYQDDAGIWRNKLDDWVDTYKKEFFEKTGLKQEDFYFDNKTGLNHKLRQQAVYDTITEVKQGVEGFIHNMNSLQSRSGNQLPFSSINYGTCTEEEGRIIIKAIIETTLRGTGDGQTSIFPCQIFQKKKGINDKGSKNYDLYQLAIRCTAKRMYPNYGNCDWSGDADTMDTRFKQMFLNSLTSIQQETLIKQIQERPELSDILGIDLVED